MIDLEEIRSMAARNPHMRVNTLLHLLEKRKKVEELQAAQYQQHSGKSHLQQAFDDGRLKPEPSFWEKLMGRG